MNGKGLTSKQNNYLKR